MSEEKRENINDKGNATENQPENQPEKTPERTTEGKSERKRKGGIAKKILKITGNVLLYLLLACALFVLIISIVSKKDSDGTAEIFGYQLRFVQSDSMEECPLTDVSDYEIQSISVQSCVFVEVAPSSDAAKEKWYKSLRVGDVLTFKYVYSRQETITHRIVKKEEKPTGGYIITLEGDNKNAEADLLQQTIDTSLTDSPNYIIGKVTGQSYLLGLLVYALKTPVGILCLIIIPCLIVIIFEVIKLVRVFGADKKEKLKEERKKREDEIEDLKRQLAALQNDKQAPAPVQPTESTEAQAPEQAPQQPQPTKEAEASRGTEAQPPEQVPAPVQPTEATDGEERRTNMGTTKTVEGEK